ncbi:LysR family transcriptional regulator [Phreatobacter stygius]|uniref:LysR family transcriptional regulator n=1 Tax=Phreatobacter stygius TaxID=1940610 RepID=A0A4D7B1C2_9HYPH|nr:LysR family transcriptional regulator [Phreatobacter stygius]QCI66581.1 LysR family transcriptional regulator [Phreatobacter stygius]
MHLSRVDLNLFVVFDTIYAEGGITRASQRLNLSQPAISHALGRLRQMFDDPLFTRHGHVMTPTPLARRMIEPIRQSLQQLELTLNKVDRFDPAGATKRFTIGIRDVLESVVLPNFMRGIARDAPHIDISIVRAERRELESELSAGTLDVAIDILLPLADEIRRRRVSAEGLAVVARRQHRHVRPGLDLDSYLAQEHIVVSARRRGQTAEDFELGRHNLGRRVRLRCQNYFAACHVVSETDLILTMPERYAGIINAQFKNQLLPFPLEVSVVDIYLYWHANADADPANAWLRQQLLAALQEGTAAARGSRPAPRT